jgi:2'-5' RNA ligase
MTERLFVALWPDDGVRAQLTQVCSRFALEGGRVIASLNLHVTLVFLGNADAERRGCIEQALGSVAAGAFDIAFTHAEWRRRTGIVWLAMDEAPAPLLALVADLRTALAACGHAPESRPYRLHLTLARDVARAPHREAIAPIRWRADTMALVSSRLTAMGSEYSVVTRWPLA